MYICILCAPSVRFPCSLFTSARHVGLIRLSAAHFYLFRLATLINIHWKCMPMYPKILWDKRMTRSYLCRLHHRGTEWSEFEKYRNFSLICNLNKLGKPPSFSLFNIRSSSTRNIYRHFIDNPSVQRYTPYYLHFHSLAHQRHHTCWSVFHAHIPGYPLVVCFVSYSWIPLSKVSALVCRVNQPLFSNNCIPSNHLLTWKLPGKQNPFKTFVSP